MKLSDLVVEQTYRGKTYLLQAPRLVFDFFLAPLGNRVIGPRVSKLVEAYFADIPPGALCSVRRNGPWKSLVKGVITRDLNKLRDATDEVFLLMDYRGATDEGGGAPTDYGLHVESWGQNESFGAHDRVPVVSVWFPAEQASGDIDAIVERFVRYAEMVPFEAGGAGLRIELRKSDYAETWWNWEPLADPEQFLGSERHPWREWSAHRAAGAMWLTVLGDQLVDRLGGFAALAQQVAPAIATEILGGACLRASRWPALGAAPNPTDLGLLPRVARALEPLSVSNPDANKDPAIHYRRLFEIPDGPYDNGEATAPTRRSRATVAARTASKAKPQKTKPAKPTAIRTQTTKQRKTKPAKPTATRTQTTKQRKTKPATRSTKAARG